MSDKNKTISEKMDDLNQMIDWFNSEDFKLEEALEKYNQAEKLATEIEKDLLSLKNEIQIVRNKFDN